MILMQKSSRIYVAGHTGLIGSALVRRLRNETYTNLVLRTHQELELTDRSAVEDFFNEVRPEYVLLAAGRVGGIVENQTYPADFLDANLAIQLNVMQAAQQYGVTRLVFFGSSCMYPRECQQPMRESALLSGKPEPTSLAYAISKLAGLQMCAAYNQQYGGRRFISVIPNSVYGPYDNFNPNAGHVLSALIRRFHAAKTERAPSVTLWGTGTPRREFIHADDLASACIHLLSRDSAEVDFPLNIGTGRDYAISELAQLISEVVEYSGAILWDATKPNGAPAKLLDSSKMHELGWHPHVDLRDGVAATYRWYLDNVA